MQLNILVLSQNLKSLSPPPSYSHLQTQPPQTEIIDLDRSARFFDLFLEGADSVVKRAKEGGEGLEGFDLEELKALVELWWREGVESPQREVCVRSKREMGEALLDLSEVLWDR